jgi:RNA polymerase sigma-54 factor
MSTLRLGLIARAEQRMALLPRMLQSIEILQLATTDLLALIDEELAQNEALELVRPAEQGPAPNRDEGASDRKSELLAAIPDREKDLWAHVRDEVALLDLDPELATCVLELASCLDERGYLSTGTAELDDRFGAALVGRARCVLMRIEPCGLGARGPLEAMLCQLADDDPDRPAIAALLEDHLEALARDRVTEVAGALSVDLDELEGLLARISRLDPRPGARFAERDCPGIRPDVLVRVVDGRHEVVVDEHSLPLLEVREDYAMLAVDRRTPRDLRRYLGGKLRSARELIEAVENRKRTLCEVAAAILTAQAAFLRSGRRAIRPLRMAEVAERVGLHPSTVSRAIAGKHLGHPGGVIALRAFFDGGAPGAAGRHGREAVRELVREAVGGEDPQTPHSDEAIQAWLAARGVRIARRTVAKHRAELGIPPAGQRRRRSRGDRPGGP